WTDIAGSIPTLRPIIVKKRIAKSSAPKYHDHHHHTARSHGDDDIALVSLTRGSRPHSPAKWEGKLNRQAWWVMTVRKGGEICGHGDILKIMEIDIARETRRLRRLGYPLSPDPLAVAGLHVEVGKRGKILKQELFRAPGESGSVFTFLEAL
ncbi:MAG: hypothetical protein Q9188_006064, partial [Gyalolechia gomerana]